MFDRNYFNESHSIPSYNFRYKRQEIEGTMKTFIDNDFILESESAKTLYHCFAENEPIFDYHCHLSPKEISEDRHFSNLSELWLANDHYKWRLMRADGIAEDYITGNADPYEKFLAWARTISHSIGNPLYHWTHLELQRYFHVDELLNEKTAPEIWKTCNRQIASPEFRVKNILSQFQVKALATTDDPVDDLRYHQQMAADASFPVRVLPTFRPEKALRVASSDFRAWVDSLEKICGIKIESLEALEEALTMRAEFFNSVGCHGADQSFAAPDFTVHDQAAAQEAFFKGLDGRTPTAYEINAYETVLMLYLGRLYHRLGWAMQLHLGAVRNNNSRMFKQLGPDTGYDSIGDTLPAASLSALLDNLEATGELPSTIIFTLNANDYAKIATMAGCFQKAGKRSKVQLGAAWWFHDHKGGMMKQMEMLANTGLLANFTGMLTDSRSFLSYPRHEYFRRILCNLVGDWIEKREMSSDIEAAGAIIKDICFRNAMDFYGLEL